MNLTGFSKPFQWKGLGGRVSKVLGVLWAQGPGVGAESADAGGGVGGGAEPPPPSKSYYGPPKGPGAQGP